MTRDHKGLSIVHDFLVGKGGAERVALSLMHAFPDAPLYTLLYEPTATFPEFAKYDIRPSFLNRSSWLRRHHRASFPIAAIAFSQTRVRSPVVICSSSGWSHGVSASGRKLVLCYNPARWLYQPDEYFGHRGAFKVATMPARVLLRSWDRRAARGAATYVAISSTVRDRIKSRYGKDAEIVHPPPTLDAQGIQTPVAGIAAGFFLCVARLLPYKNVNQIVSAFRLLPRENLVVVGEGPEWRRLQSGLPTNVNLVGRVVDRELTWLYAHAKAVVAASHEDYGLTPLEGYLFGKPSVTLGSGGFLDTVDPDFTGLFFDLPDPTLIADAIKRLNSRAWDVDRIRSHAATFAETHFIERIRAITDSLG